MSAKKTKLSKLLEKIGMSKDDLVAKDDDSTRK